MTIDLNHIDLVLIPIENEVSKLTQWQIRKDFESKSVFSLFTIVSFNEN